MSNTPDSKPKKILIFSLMYFPRFVGGAEVAIKEITDRIDPKDAAFEIITLKMDNSLPKTEMIGNVLVHRIGFGKSNPTISDLDRWPLKINKWLFPISAFLKARLLCKKTTFDASWAMMSYMGLPAIFLKRLKKIPYILTLQEGDPLDKVEKKMLFLWPIYKKVFSSAAKTTAISEFLRSWARRMGAKKPVIIPNGVDVEKFLATGNEKTTTPIRKNIGVKDSEILVFTSSRLVPKNGISDAIKAFQYLPARFKFAIAGDGHLEKELKGLARSLGLSQRIIFLGFKKPEEIPDYLRESDIFLRPSLSEGLGNSFLEAMAAGVPVVGTNAGGISDFLADGVTGLVCLKGNPKDIAEKISKLAENENLKEQISGNAFQMVKDRFNWNIIAESFKEIIFSMSSVSKNLPTLYD